ncbi:hypothetical protein [Hymenobacter actinosclerus]|uniref:Short chain amide porin n=1 Tax=Hymenobacter actinosclerus TaxID=82805 RepID=A0A1I0EIE3_9BACT|nr:hypothetical protein [Hymenobacter actinosclerus]SET44725.1 hypothetical protein SAMN04487998_1850 [Hymenobacter actinosclerus]
MRNVRYPLAVSALLLAATASAQVQPTPPGNPPAPAPAPQAPPPPAATPTESVPYGAGLKVNMSPDGSKYFRIISWHQVWTRYNKNNTGSQRVAGDPESSTFDVGLRRSRLLLYAQLNPRFLIITHLGINNQNAVGGGVGIGDPGKKPQLFVHEAVVEYKVFKYLNIGAGLHYQNGISRMSRASTLNMLAYDVPIVNWPTIEKTDQFARGLGIYAKGRVGKLDYVLAMNDPFATNQAQTPATQPLNVADFNPRNSHKSYQGYLAYEFLDQEANLLPYQTGSYLGTKRVFNIGAGFLFNKDAMISRTGAVPVPTPADPFASVPNRLQNLGVWSADVFYDSPINKDAGTALTAYGVYYNYNFGSNYVRNIGSLNPSGAGGSNAIPGAGTLRGNTYPTLGTGSALYGQVGYLLPKNVLGEKARVQPYAAWMHGNFDGLKEIGAKDVNVYDLGANVLLDGHNAKLTLNYRARPDYSNPQNINYRPEITLQTMIFL